MTVIDWARRGRLPLSALLVSTALCAPALAETLTVTGVASSKSDAFSLEIPTVEVTDGNVDEAAVRALFTTAPGQALDAFAALDATSLVVPTITMVVPEAGPGNGTATVTVRDIRFDGVSDGIASTASIGGIDIDAGSGIKVTFGEIAAPQFNFAGLLGYYGLVAAQPSDVKQLIFARSTFAGGSITGPMFSCDIAPGSTESLKARPLKTPLAQFYTLMAEAETAQKDGSDVSPATVRAIVDYYIDSFTAAEQGKSVLEGMTCSGTGDGNTPFSFKLAGFGTDAYAPPLTPAFWMKGLDIDVGPKGTFKLGDFTWKQMDLSTTIAALQAAVTLDEAWFAANWRKLIPAMDGLSLGGLDFDIEGDAPGQRVVASLGNLDVTLADYVNGLPADIAITIADLVSPIPPGAMGGDGPDLAAYGITTLDLDFASHIVWNQAEQTISLNDLTLDVAQLGRVTLSGTLGNATDVLFGDNPEAATLAAQMLTVKDLTLGIKDYGMSKIAWAEGAKASGQPVEAFQLAMAGMAQGYTVAFLGNSPDTLEAATALSAFLGGAPEVSLTLTAIDPAGVGLVDFAALEADPTALANKVTIKANPVESTPATTGAISPAQDEKLGLKAPAPVN